MHACAAAGAGVGKGRTIAGLVLENWRCGRKRHLWLTIGSDLRIDSRRDLDDVGAGAVPLHPLNKLPYGALDSDKARCCCASWLLCLPCCALGRDGRRHCSCAALQACARTHSPAAPLAAG
jgi:hypothetical protein